jgi:hypothetical protein
LVWLRFMRVAQTHSNAFGSDMAVHPVVSRRRAAEMAARAVDDVQE